MKWVLINKLSELTGYTEDAANKKRSNGVWLKDTHWKKAPDDRILYNIQAIYKWIEQA